MLLGDARTGKLSDNITGFARALRRAGLPIDASRISLAIESTGLVGIERKDDLAAALKACLVSRQEDLIVFDQSNYSPARRAKKISRARSTGCQKQTKRPDQTPSR